MDLFIRYRYWNTVRYFSGSVQLFKFLNSTVTKKYRYPCTVHSSWYYCAGSSFFKNVFNHIRRRIKKTQLSRFFLCSDAQFLGCIWSGKKGRSRKDTRHGNICMLPVPCFYCSGSRLIFSGMRIPMSSRVRIQIQDLVKKTNPDSPDFEYNLNLQYYGAGFSTDPKIQFSSVPELLTASLTSNQQANRFRYFYHVLV